MALRLRAESSPHRKWLNVAAASFFMAVSIRHVCSALEVDFKLMDSSNNYVEIDFSRSLENVDLPDVVSEQILNLTVGDHQVSCLLPRRHFSGYTTLDVLRGISDSAVEASGTFDPGAWDQRLLWAATHSANASNGVERPEPKLMSRESVEQLNYLRAARLRWILDRCFRFSDLDDEWQYELCVGRKVTRFKGKDHRGQTMGKTFFELGTYASGKDQIWETGSLTQWYVDGTGGHQTEVIFECGDSQPVVKGIQGPIDGRYRLWVEAPMFCDFRESAPAPVLTESLLRSLEGWCSNFTTNGWWSYEYCHPDSLIQYHKEPTGEVVGPMFLLGTLQSSSSSPEALFRKPLADAPILRGPDTNLPSSSGKPRFKFLPVEVVDPPLNVDKSMNPRSNKVLAMYLTNGTMCKGTGKPRKARILFECPEDFPMLATHSVVRVVETSMCSFDMTVHTPLVCPHPKILPPRPPDPQSIVCFPSAGRLDHNSVVPLSWRDLQAVHAPHSSPQDSERRSISLKLETLPQSIDPLRAYNDAGFDLFGLGNYVRNRVSAREPRFHIGQLVKHRWWGYTAVVLAWDESCRATSEWIQEVYSVYQPSNRARPHYLVLVSTSRAEDEPILWSYVPESALTPMESPRSEFAHPHLTSFFGAYSASDATYSPSEDQIAQRFPLDV